MLKRSIRKSVVVVLLSPLFITGCATNDSKSDIGGNWGAILGAAVGAHQGKGKSKDRQLFYTLAGATLGGATGRGVGKKLDAKDRAKMESAAQTALASNRVQTWSNPRNKTAGKVTPIRTSLNSGRTCRTINEVVSVNGRTNQQKTTACKGSNGWVIQP